jgi:hypothetical protein
MKVNDMGSFVRWYRGLKAKPNFTSLAEHGKPSSAGKKPRKGVSKKVSKEIQSIVLNATEEDLLLEHHHFLNSSASVVTPLHLLMVCRC